MTTEDIHPRQYLDYFIPLTKPEYPVFMQYTEDNEARMSGGQDFESSGSQKDLRIQQAKKTLEGWLNKKIIFNINFLFKLIRPLWNAKWTCLNWWKITNCVQKVFYLVL